MASYFVNHLQPLAYVYLLHFYGHLLCNDISEYHIHMRAMKLPLFYDGSPECYNTTNGVDIHTHTHTSTHTQIHTARPTGYM